MAVVDDEERSAIERGGRGTLDPAVEREAHLRHLPRLQGRRPPQRGGARGRTGRWAGELMECTVVEDLDVALEQLAVRRRPRRGGPAGRRAARWRESRRPPARSSRAPAAARVRQPRAGPRAAASRARRDVDRLVPNGAAAAPSRTAAGRRGCPAASAPVPAPCSRTTNRAGRSSAIPDRLEVARDGPAEDRVALRRRQEVAAPARAAVRPRRRACSSRPPGRRARAP